MEKERIGEWSIYTGKRDEVTRDLLDELNKLIDKYEEREDIIHADMMDTALLPDHIRYGRILKFYLIRGFNIGLQAAFLHMAGDTDVIDNHGTEICAEDYSDIFLDEAQVLN